MSTLPSNSASPLKGESLAGKYLTFCLGQEYYGIPVLKIREIVRVPEITAVPQVPDYVRGVINLRGKIIPVIDLRRRFHFAQDAMGERTCVVIVQVRLPDGEASSMGLVVDSVDEVVSVPQEDIEETPRFGSKLQAGYILGMAKVKGRVKALLDIDTIVGADALMEIAAGAA